MIMCHTFDPATITFHPDVKLRIQDQPEGHTEANDACAEVSRTERLARLRSRAHTQAMAVFHSSIGRAQELIGQLTVHGEQLTKMVSVANISSTLAQITAVLNFAYVSAKTMSIPLVVQGLDVAIHETHNINEQLKDVSW